MATASKEQLRLPIQEVCKGIQSPDFIAALKSKADPLLPNESVEKFCNCFQAPDIIESLMKQMNQLSVSTQEWVSFIVLCPGYCDGISKY